MAKKMGSWVYSKWMEVAPPKVTVPYKPASRFPQKLQTIVEDTNEGRVDQYMTSSSSRAGFDSDPSSDFPPLLF